jgi:hypothetical protein
MSRRHTTGFSVLGMDRDPTPGDPDQIDQLARFYEEIRDDAQTGVRVLGRGGSLSRARGESMEKLRDMLDSLPRKLQQAVDSFDAAAQAYRTYAQALRDQQTRIDTAMDQATDAMTVVRRIVPPVAVDATPEQIAAAKASAGEIAGARDQLSAAQRLAADARRLREIASARCNRALDDAASKAIKPPPRRNFFQRIGDFFRNNPIFRLIIDIVIAVVGVLLPVVGIVLAAVALVVTVAVQAANGNFELGTLVVGLVALVPGAKLIGSLARGAKAVAPGLVKAAGSAGKAFGQFGRNNTVVSGALRFGSRGGGFGKQVVTDFGKGVVEEVATVGLNKLGDPNSADFNAASIFGGAAAGAAAGGLADGFRKSFSDGPDLDLPSRGGTDGLSGADVSRGGADLSAGGSTGDGDIAAGNRSTGDSATAAESSSAVGSPPAGSTQPDPPAGDPAPSPTSGGDGTAGTAPAPTAAPSQTTDAASPPTVAPPTVAPPTVAPPTAAPPTVAAPTLSAGEGPTTAGPPPPRPAADGRAVSDAESADALPSGKQPGPVIEPAASPVTPGPAVSPAAGQEPPGTNGSTGEVPTTARSTPAPGSGSSGPSPQVPVSIGPAAGGSAPDGPVSGGAGPADALPGGKQFEPVIEPVAGPVDADPVKPDPAATTTTVTSDAGGPSASLPAAISSVPGPVPGGSRPEPDTTGGPNQPTESTDAPSAGQESPAAGKADEEPDPEDSIEERAGEAVTNIVSDGASDAASAAIENRQDEDEEAEDSPVDVLTEAALKAGAVLGVADAASGPSEPDDSTGFTKRFRR